MKVDPIRIKNYLSEIKRNSLYMQELLDENKLVSDSIIKAHENQNTSVSTPAKPPAYSVLDRSQF